MDVYVARQPIFDRKLAIFGYELLYRKSMNNYYEGTDANVATAELINNVFLTMDTHTLTGGGKAFINFTKEGLIEKLPMILPSKAIVVEILETVKIDRDVIEACKNLRQKNYTIALDDFVFHEEYLPLIELAQIIKIEFPAVSLEEQKQLIQKYKGKVKFLAEKVETREEYQIAYDMGYDYFQGYFFSKPIILKDKEVSPLNINLLKILEILNSPEPEYREISDIIGMDLGLSYKLLRLASSVAFGSPNYKINHISQALPRLGFDELRRWIYILIMADRQIAENKELIRNCLIRAKIMELAAFKINKGEIRFEYFITGMLSSIDVLTNKEMSEIVEELFLVDEVKKALLGEKNHIKHILDMVIEYELTACEGFAFDEDGDEILMESLGEMYMEALTWVMNLNY